MLATRLASTLRRRLLAELGRGYPTRRRLARCGRLVQAALEAAPRPAALESEPPPLSAARPAEAGPMTAPACPTCPVCFAADLYASRARPGLFRCRHCGTEITGDTPA